MNLHTYNKFLRSLREANNSLQLTRVQSPICRRLYCICIYSRLHLIGTPVNRETRLVGTPVNRETRLIGTQVSRETRLVGTLLMEPNHLHTS